MKRMRFTSLLLAMLMVVSVFGVSANTEGEPATPSAPTLIADWGDMSQAASVTNEGPVNAKTGNYALYGTSGYNAKKETVGYMPNYGLGFINTGNTYGEIKTSSGNTYDATLFNAFSTSFTFETWIKMDVTGDGAIFEMRNEAGSATDGERSYGGLYTAKQNTEATGNVDKQNLIFKRKFDSGFAVFTSSQYFTVGEWHHIVCSYDASNPANVPVITVDGAPYTMNVTGTAPTGNAAQFTSNIVSDAEKNVVMLGQSKFGASPSFVKNGYYSELRIYSGVSDRPDAWALEQYNKTAGQFMADYADVTFYDRFGIEANKSALPAAGNKITVDLAGADKDTVTAETVYINDVTTNARVLVDAEREWDGSSYVLSGFTLTDGGEYELCILKTITDAEDRPLRAHDQRIPFVCDAANALHEIGNWSTQARTDEGGQIYFADKGGSNLYLTQPISDSGLTATKKTLGYNDKEYTDTMHTGLSVVAKDGEGNYTEGSTKIVDAFKNKNITFETWFNIPTDASTQPRGSMFAIWDETNSKNVLLLDVVNSASPYLEMRGYLSTGTPTYMPMNQNTAPLKKGQWYHIVFTSSGTACKLYVNGVEKFSGYALEVNPDATTIISRFGAGWQYQSGQRYDLRDVVYDDISVWNGALTDAQVTSIYNSEKADYVDYGIALKDNSDAAISYSAYAGNKNLPVKSLALSGDYTYSGVTAKNKVTGEVTSLTVTDNTVSLASLKPGAYTLTVNGDYSVDVVVCENSSAVIELTPGSITTAKVINNADAGKDITVYLAKYEDNTYNKLVDIKTGKATVANNGAPVTISTTEELDITNGYYKVFVFDGGLKPLTKAVIGD